MTEITCSAQDAYEQGIEIVASSLSEWVRSSFVTAIASMFSLDRREVQRDSELAIDRQKNRVDTLAGLVTDAEADRADALAEDQEFREMFMSKPIPQLPEWWDITREEVYAMGPDEDDYSPMESYYRPPPDTWGEVFTFDY